MSGIFERWRRARVLKGAPLADHVWDEALAGSELTAGLGDAERTRLRELCTMFLHDKTIQGAAGLELDDRMRLGIALNACILILNLPYEWYDGWVEVIVYPDKFAPQVEWEDEYGVVHTGRESRAGEAWLQGPVVLSWADVGNYEGRGLNAALHEFAHKLDMVNGDTDGFPPLHADMNRTRWTEAFSAAFDHLKRQADRDLDTPIDPYAVKSPGEFFAVFTEVFFERPEVVKDCYPQVYEQLAAFYRQDPFSRQVRAGLINVTSETPHA